MARWPFYGATLLLVGCDHATKVAATETLFSGRVITLVRGWLDLRYTENFDAAFSLTHSWNASSKGVVLTATSLAITALVMAIAWRRRERSSTVEHAALALILAGAIGNTVDRIGHGYVVDFIHVQHWPVFNVADALIVVGAALLARASASLARG